MIDGYKAYRSAAFQALLQTPGISDMPPYPAVDRALEWQGRAVLPTMLEECAYARAYRDDAHRRRAAGLRQ